MRYCIFGALFFSYYMRKNLNENFFADEIGLRDPSSFRKDFSGQSEKIVSPMEECISLSYYL